MLTRKHGGNQLPLKHHPLYEQWRKASDHLTKASKRSADAERNGPVGEKNLARRDLEKAQADYDKISEEIG
jgi:hypothetical protein